MKTLILVGRTFRNWLVCDSSQSITLFAHILDCIQISYAVIVSQERHNVLDLPDAEGLSPGGDDFPGFRSARDVPVGESVENAKEQDPPVHPFFRQNSDASAATRNGNQKKALSRSASGTNNSDVISIADSDDEGLTPLSEDGTDKAVITLAVERAVNGQKSMQRDQFK